MPPETTIPSLKEFEDEVKRQIYPWENTETHRSSCLNGFGLRITCKLNNTTYVSDILICDEMFNIANKDLSDVIASYLKKIRENYDHEFAQVYYQKK